MTTSFLQDTSSSPVSPGVRRAMVTDRWNTPLGTPNGGYALALCMRAASDELEVGRPAAVSISYLSPPRPDVEAEFRIRPVKLGRRVQTVEVEMLQEDKAVLHTVVNFLRDHEGFTAELGKAPELPSPDECLDPSTDSRSPGGIMDRLEQRWPRIPGWIAGEPDGDPQFEHWVRLVGSEPVDWFALAMLCDASPPPLLELGPRVSMTVQLTVHLHRLPAPGSWIASRMSTKHVVDGMHEEDGELWDEDGNLLAQSRQLAILLS